MNLFPIAVDIGLDGLRAAQWQTRHGRLQVRAAHAAPLCPDEAGREASILEVLRHLRRGGEFSGRRAVLLPPVRSIFTYPLRVTLAGGETVEQAAVRDCLKVLPYPAEEALLDFLSLDEPAAGRGGSARAVAIAMPRQQVNRYLALFQQAGLTLEVVDHHLPALLRLARQAQAAPDRLTLLCWLGRHDSFVAVCDQDRGVVCRSIEWGIQPICDRLRESLNVAAPGNLLRDFGIAPASEQAETGDAEADDVARVVRQLSRPLMEELVAELHGVMGYVRSESLNHGLKTAQIFGPGGDLRGLPALLDAELGLAARVFEAPKDLWAGEAPADGAQFELALGLGLRKLSWP